MRVGTVQVTIVDVFDHGVFDPSEARAGEHVDVNGKVGFYRQDMSCKCLGVHMNPGIAWEYAPDSWALVRLAVRPPGADDLKAELLRVSRAVRFDRTISFRVPFKVGYLPRGLRPGPASYKPSPTDPWVGVTLSGAGANAPRLTIGATKPRTHPPVGKVTGDEKVREPVYADVELTVNLGGFMVSVSSPDPGLSVDELRKVAKSITAAGDWRDPSTWIEAGQAIPTT